MSSPPGDRPHTTESSMDPVQIRNVLEACLLVAGKAMSVAQLQALFGEAEEPDRSGERTGGERPERAELLAALASLQDDYQGRGIELVEVASGWRLQSRASMEPWVARLFQERPPRYSRALLETLVLVAYRQPITRGEIEQVRGVAVSSNIIRTLQEREWVREVGHKEVPGRPALLGTTRQFLDYFNLKRLEDLPPLGELKDLDSLEPALAAATGDLGEAANGSAANDGGQVDETIGDADESDGATTVVADVTDTPVSADASPPSAKGADGSMTRDEQEPGPAFEGQLDADPEIEPEPEPEPEPELPVEAQPYEDPQARLRRVIDRFAADHRADLQAHGRWRDEASATTVDAEPDGGAAERPVSNRVDAAAPERDDDVP